VTAFARVCARMCPAIDLSQDRARAFSSENICLGLKGLVCMHE
jgi:hypothetical protein